MYCVQAYMARCPTVHTLFTIPTNAIRYGGETQNKYKIERNTKVARHYYNYLNFFQWGLQISSFIGQNERTEHSFFLSKISGHRRMDFVQ
jgi:hypothetical protein